MTALSVRLYQSLMLLYPDDLRRNYGQEMLLLFADDLEHARRTGGRWEAIRIWRIALREFLPFALPACLSSSAIRVPAITFVLFSIMTSGEMACALVHAPNAPSLLHAVRAALVLPLFSTPFISLLAIWNCRGTVTSLHLAGEREGGPR